MVACYSQAKRRDGVPKALRKDKILRLEKVFLRLAREYFLAIFLSGKLWGLFPHTKLLKYLGNNTLVLTITRNITKMQPTFFDIYRY